MGRTRKSVVDLDTIEDRLARVEQQGEEVYSLSWNNEWSGGLIRVLRYRKRYYAYSTDDIDPGPYPSLEEALARGAGAFGACDVEISCSAMPAEQLVEHLDCYRAGLVIRVNEQCWRMDATGAAPCGDSFEVR